jgi:acetyl esterase/lipase
MPRVVLAIVVCLLLSVNATTAELRVDKNVVYGMFSGLALLMDVYYPEKPNGFGVIVIPGSGWQAELRYGASPLKDGQLARDGLVQPIVAAGYTAFVVTHRAAPTFHYPAAVDDVQRAVRFVRHSARERGIDPARIGAVGHSSGGHLAAMLGVLEGLGNSKDVDLVNRENAHVQAVVTVAAPTDLAAFGSAVGASFADTFVGAVHLTSGGRPHPEGSAEWRLFQDASPISWVSSEDAPTLLIHGDRDPIVPVAQSETMFKALQAVGVKTQFFRVPSGGHVWAKDWAGFPGMIVEWLDQHLKRSAPIGK